MCKIGIKRVKNRVVMDRPLVSIITVSKDSEKFIEETIQSVLKQTYSNIEFIIIDGASTDGTIEIIKKYDSEITSWLSEPDSGMYSALNKGMLKVTGDIVAYINSDDLYHQDTISRVVEIFNDSPNSDLIYGGLDFIDEYGCCLFTQKYPTINWNYFVTFNYQMLGQPATFWRKTLLDKLGGFDESLKMSADFEFFVRAGRLGSPMQVEDILASFRVHSSSLTGAQCALGIEEVALIHVKYNVDNSNLSVHIIRLFYDLRFKIINWRVTIAKCFIALRKYRNG